MDIVEFYNIIYDNNIDLQLIGNIELIDDQIKWEYDALGDEYIDLETHLVSIYEIDYEIIKDYIEEKKLDAYITILPPEFDDIYVSFYIVDA